MLAIRLQRTGRTGHAQFRIIVQDSHRSPKSGKIVARLGSYNPHAKTVEIDKEKAAHYLKHGAQPSDRVITLLKKEAVKMPDWVKQPIKKEGKVRNPEKLAKDAPVAEVPPEVIKEDVAETTIPDTVVAQTEPAKEAEETVTEEATEEKA